MKANGGEKFRLKLVIANGHSSIGPFREYYFNISSFFFYIFPSSAFFFFFPIPNAKNICYVKVGAELTFNDCNILYSS